MDDSGVPLFLETSIWRTLHLNQLTTIKIKWRFNKSLKLYKSKMGHLGLSDSPFPRHVDNKNWSN